MISRRIYVAISALMVSILFLCMSLPHLKDGLNDYMVNQYTETAENYPSKANIYIPLQFGIENLPKSQEESLQTTTIPYNLVTYIGNSNQPTQDIVSEWVTYTKRNIACFPTLEAYQADETIRDVSNMLIIDPTSIDWNSESMLNTLDECLEKGVSLIFSGLPELSIIQSNKRVRDLLGIKEVYEEKVEVDGFYLREGFLLGGSTFYLKKQADNQEENPGSKAFPVDTTLPWLLPASGSKVYMQGIFQDPQKEDSDDESENNPILIWRHRQGNGYVFVENGNFLSNQVGIGLLSAMAAEINSYELYPIVNAQTLVLTGFPALTDENSEVINEIYSRSIKQVQQELMWPSISEILRRYKYKATCMVAPQYEYSEDEKPDEKLLKYYLKMFAEQAIETGLDQLSDSNISLLEKLDEDEQFFQEALDGYPIVSFYARDLEDEQIIQGAQSKVLSSTRTVIRDYEEKVAPVEFLAENVTAQSVICDGFDWTYESDFLVRSMQTALGYLNINCDLSQITYPQNETSTWDHLSGFLASTLTLYGELYPEFSKLASAQGDERIRQFLSMNFNQSRTGNEIEINIESFNDKAWFILRTHNEAIQEIEGGNFTELEKDAYLIEITQPNATLIMGPADQRYIQ